MSVYTPGLRLCDDGRRTVVGPETRFCPPVCVFEGLKPEFCCFKFLSQTELLFCDDAFTPAAPVLFITNNIISGSACKVVEMDVKQHCEGKK